MPLPVQHIMMQHPPSLPLQSTLQDAAERLMKEGQRHLYIVDEQQRLQGILPDYEVVKARLNQLDFRTSISPFITRSLETVSPETSLESIFSHFRIGWLQFLPVVSQGILRGEISRSQILKVLMLGELPIPSDSRNSTLKRPPNFLQRSSGPLRRELSNP